MDHGAARERDPVADVLLQVITEQNLVLALHLNRVAKLAEWVTKALDQPGHEIQRICLAARLHDIGKTAIPALLLDKPGPLDVDDWAVLRQIPLIGERIALAAPALANTAPLIRSCHERADGHGYPDGLAGHQIPLGSRIIAVCDAFDVMTSLYGPRLASDAALEELHRHAGTQFDATIVEAFCRSPERSPTMTREEVAAIVSG